MIQREYEIKEGITNGKTAGKIPKYLE